MTHDRMATERPFDPCEGRSACDFAVDPVHATLDAEVRSFPSRGVHIRAIDADRRRTQKLTTYCLCFSVDANELNLRGTRDSCDRLASMVRGDLDVRAAIEIENLDRSHVRTLAST